MKEIKSVWLRLTEERNAIDYLRQAHFYISRTEVDLMAWKWVVICLHGALYGFAICAIKGTYTGNVTYKTRNGIQKLITFGEAIKRCQDQEKMRFAGNDYVLELSDDQRRSISFLKDEFRNNFEHYIPKGWSIEVHGFPEIAMHIMDIIKILALQSRNRIHLKKKEKQEIKSIVFQSKKFLKHCQLYKDDHN
jgi:hypothetical protein